MFNSGEKAKSFKIRYGSSKHFADGTLVRVKQIINHELFNYKTVDYDFALLKLMEEIVPNKHQNIVQLIGKNKEVDDGADCQVTGWGTTQNANEGTDMLRVVSVPIVNHSKCNKMYASYGGITNQMICAGLKEGGKDSCFGDSGGPLVCGTKLVGVVSWGNGCAKPNYPGIYAKVAAAKDWIDKHTRG